MNGLTAMRRCPSPYDVTLALADALRGAGFPCAAGFVSVSTILDMPEPSVRLAPAHQARAPLSELLSGVLERGFDAEAHGWVIDAREARMLIRRFHRWE